MALGLVIAVAVAALAAFGTTLAQDSAPAPRAPFEEWFTYQGRLEVDGVPANGTHTIKIETWDGLTGGSLLTATTSDVEVANGLFAMTVAAGDLDGEGLWLQALAWDGAQFVPLGARQELTPVAYAIFAAKAGSLSTEAAAGFIQNGTTLQPSSNFHISGNGIADGAFDASKYQVGGEDFAYLFGQYGGLAIGQLAGSGPNATRDNTFVGFRSGTALTNGEGNTALGSVSLNAITSGDGNTAIGTVALNLVSTGSYNTAVGNWANAFNSGGSNNVTVGHEAGYSTYSSDNTIVGAFAGRNFTTGSANVFVGKNAGRGNLGQSTGEQNVVVGADAGLAMRAAYLSTLVGDHAGTAITNGLANTAIGFAAGSDITDGDTNTFVGGLAGDGITFGNSNTALGYTAKFSTGSLTYATAIGALAEATASNQVQLGRNGMDTIRIGTFAAATATHVCMTASNVLASCSSSARYKTNIAEYTGGLDILEQLSPVTFDWKGDGSHDLGFVAEAVEAVDPLLVTYKDGQVEGVKYDRISAVLVNSVMEQQAQIDALSAGVAPQTGNAIEARLTALESQGGQPWLLIAMLGVVAAAAGATAGFFAGRSREA